MGHTKGSCSLRRADLTWFLCRYRGAFVLFSLLTLLGCDDAVGRPGVTRHPILDSLSINPDEAVVVHSEPADGPPEALGVFRDRLAQRKGTVAIGVMDGDSAYIFGEVVDAEFLSDGSVAILDRQARDLRVFDESGEFRYSVGGPGEGPGEMDFPVALVVPSPGELWVVEGGRGIHRFQEEVGGLAFLDRLDIESYSVRDACVLGEQVVVHIPSHVTMPDQSESRFAEVLFSYDRAGDRRSAFSVPYRYSAWLVSERMNRGLITCAPPDMVLIGFENQNRMDAYRASNGEIQWHATFEGIQVLSVKEEVRPDGRRSVSSFFDEGPPFFHTLVSVTGGEGAPAIVQFARKEKEDVRNRLDRSVLETYLLDVESGEGLLIGEDLPRILTISQNRVVFLEVDPFPRIVIEQIPLRGR